MGRPAGTALAAGIAAVWAHQGLWCKVLGRRPRHEAIVARVPGIGGRHARAVTVAIGVAEAVVAAWVLSGRAPRRAAAVQTVALLGMNGGGLLFARHDIPDVRRMLVRNAGLVVAIWAVPALRGPGA